MRTVVLTLWLGVALNGWTEAQIQPNIKVTTASLPDATLGRLYNAPLAANGGPAPHTWSQSSGALPVGLVVNPLGSITGIPLASGGFSFSVEVRALNGDTDEQSLQITVAPAVTVPLAIATASLPGGTVGVAYQQTLTATGGAGGNAWTVTAGALPGGLSLGSDGSIAGTPTAAGPSNFTVQVKDSASATTTKALSIAIAPAATVPLAITTASLPGGTVGVAYQQTLAASGGAGGNAWTVTAGALPGGLSLGSDGSIAGTPTAAGPSNFTVQVKDSASATKTKALSIAIAPAATAPLAIATASLPGGTVGVAYQQTLTATGGAGGNAWTVTAGALPAGLSLGSDGSITGSPTAAGTANFTVQVKDSASATKTKALSIAIAPAATAPLAITTASLPGGTVGVAYQQTLTATGGAGGNAWTVTAGALPGGLSLGSDGSITGSPTAAGTANFTVQVKDSASATKTKALSIAIAPAALTVTTASLPGGTVGAAYQQTLTSTGGAGGNAWSVTTGTLPAGLSLASSGDITGTPTSAGTANFTVQVKDSASSTATKALSIAIAPATLTVTTASLPAGTVGAVYQQTLTATGGAGGNAWSVATGALPAGVSLGSDGSITGTPTSAGTANFTVQVKDSASTTATKALNIAIAPATLTVTTASLPGGTVGAVYQQTLTATGGAGGNAWSVATGALPAGVSLGSDGSITGTPTSAGTANFTVQVKDSASTTATKALNIAIAPATLTVTTASLPAGTVGAAYQQTLTSTGGAGGNAWSVTTGALPAGLSLGSDGSITGTPTSAGTANFTVQVKDSASTTATKALSIAIAPAALTVTIASLPGGTVGAAYQQTVTATGGAGGNVWSLTAGVLPAGLTLGSDGSIRGTPTTVGTANFTVQVKDSSNATATKALSIAIAAAGLSVTTASLPAGTVGTAYQQTLAATGGAGGNAWSVTTGALPAGLTLGADGAITGTPTAVSTANFTVQVKDSLGTTATKALSISVTAAGLSITTASLPGGTVGAAYQQTLASTGGTGGDAWTLVGGSLPAGLSLGSDGSITGTPTIAGTANFTVQVRDGSGTTVTRALSIAIVPAALTVSTASLADATVGVAYAQNLTAAGGAGGNIWAITAGTLPAGLSLASSGDITGTPTAAGTANFTVQVRDNALASATKALTISVGPAAFSVTTPSLPSGTVGAVYQQSLASTGGSGGNTWSITTGALPAGLSLAADGGISGTPTAAGTFSFTVQVKDKAAATASKQLSIIVSPSPVTVTTSSLPDGSVGVAYQQTLVAGGGAGGYSWSVSGGALPAGLSLSATGNLAGTPTAAGATSFTVQVSDSAKATATHAFSLAINPAPLKIETSSLPGSTVGVPYSQPLSASGGSGNYSWSVSSGALPVGFSLSRTGTLSGTPGSVGTSNFAVSVTDGTSTMSRSFTITIQSHITITSPAVPAGTVGISYITTLSATGGGLPYTWTIISGQLPPGLALDAATGVISGTPLVAGTYILQLEVIDSTSARADGPLAITINAGLAITTASTLATGSAGATYSQAFAATGGKSPYEWILSGTLPAGLSFSPSGVLSGTPTQVGTFPITVQVTDAGSGKASGSFSLQVVSGLAIATPPVLPTATAGLTYTVTLLPAGGSAPYQWTVTSGSLPGGLNFGATGQITGTPTSTGTFEFTAQVTDSNSNRAQKAFTLAVSGALSITSTALPGGATLAPYAQTLSATGGTAPYTWTVTAGSLPDGLTLETPTGVLAGTPKSIGNFTFTVTVTDANGVKAQKEFTVSISAGLTFVTPASLPSATAGLAYNFTLKASGGQSPYSWSVLQGALPGGLSLNGATGVISGSPTSTGTFNITIQVSDTTHTTATQVATIVVGVPALPTVLITGLPADVQALEQPVLDISLNTPFPVAITGTATLTFTPQGANPMDDPAVQFSTGGRSVTFTIPANATHAAFGSGQFALQTGSVTGTIIISIVSLQAGGGSLTLPDGLTQTARVDPAPPVVRTLSVVHSSDGIQVQITGWSSTRDLTKATVTFQAAPGTAIQTPQLAVPLSDVGTKWFQSAPSASFGGQFSLTLPFTFTGNVSLSSVSVVLSNGAGDSTSSSGNY